MPHLLKFLLRHALIGLTIACAVVGLIFWFNIGKLATLVGAAEHGWLIVAVLTAAMGLTFASAQMGFAVMLLPGEPTEGTGDEDPSGRPVAVRQRARSSRRLDRIAAPAWVSR